MDGSAELIAFVRRFYGALAAGDLDVILNFLADDAVVVGAEDHEWLEGPAVRPGMEAIIEDIAGAEWDPTNLRAWERGEFGWSIDRPVVTAPSGASTEFRVTSVFRLKRGYWKVAHIHVSGGLIRERDSKVRIRSTIGDLLRNVQATPLDLRPLATDGTVTIVFTDIVDSTAAAERLGDVGWLSVFQRHTASVNRLASAHGGVVVKSLGDGFMLAFGSAHEALAFCWEVQGESDGVRLRVGVHVGEALRHDGDLFGHSVTVAARLAALAPGGEILVSEVVRSVLGGSRAFVFDRPRMVELKGIEEPCCAYVVSRTSPAEGAAEQTESRHEPSSSG